MSLKTTTASTVNDTVSLLANQQQICAGLSVFLSYVSDDLAGNIDIQQYNALAGSVHILDMVSKELQLAYTQLDSMSDELLQ